MLPLTISWRRPTLPGTNPSTIGAGGLNCRVRDGNGCDPSAVATRNFFFRISSLLEHLRVNWTEVTGDAEIKPSTD